MTRSSGTARVGGAHYRMLRIDRTTIGRSDIYDEADRCVAEAWRRLDGTWRTDAPPWTRDAPSYHLREFAEIAACMAVVRSTPRKIDLDEDLDEDEPCFECGGDGVVDAYEYSGPRACRGRDCWPNGRCDVCDPQGGGR